jgi:hypothetical protein
LGVWFLLSPSWNRSNNTKEKKKKEQKQPQKKNNELLIGLKNFFCRNASHKKLDMRKFISTLIGFGFSAQGRGAKLLCVSRGDQ